MEARPDRAQVRVTIALSFLLSAGAGWVLSLGDAPLNQLSAIVPFVDATLMVSDLVTATFLFAQAAVFRSRALMALASGYCCTALLIVAHALTFPGSFASTGLLGAGPSTTAWIAVFWRAGFAIAITAFIDQHNAEPKPFRWTKSADDILASIERFCLRNRPAEQSEPTSGSGH